MKRRHFHTLLCAGALWPALGRAQDLAVQALLVRSDSYRNPDFSYACRATLTEFKAGKAVDSMALRIHARPAAEKGAFHTLASFLRPARDMGKHMLKAGNDVWFYDPASSASIRLSPLQRLLGQAANADVVSTSLSAEFVPTLQAEEEIVDGERKRRATHKLLLRPSQPGAGYSKVELWVDSDTAAPIRGRFYADSGALLKTIFYRRYRQELGAQRPTEYVIIDGSDPKSVTLMQFDEFKAMDVPAQWMQKDYLPLLRIE